MNECQEKCSVFSVLFYCSLTQYPLLFTWNWHEKKEKYDFFIAFTITLPETCEFEENKSVSNIHRGDKPLIEKKKKNLFQRRTRNQMPMFFCFFFLLDSL